MFAAQILLFFATMLAALTNATPNPRFEITVVVEQSTNMNDVRPFVPQSEETPIFDCTDKQDGNYYHPTDCTRFISCERGISSQRDCANCNVDPVRCPEGRTVYNGEVDVCLLADETPCCSPPGSGKNCVGGGGEPPFLEHQHFLGRNSL